MITTTGIFLIMDIHRNAILIKTTLLLLPGCLLSTSVCALSLQESLIAANSYNAEMKAARSLHAAVQQKKYQGFAGLLPVVTLQGDGIRPTSRMRLILPGSPATITALILPNPLLMLLSMPPGEKAWSSAMRQMLSCCFLSKN